MTEHPLNRMRRNSASAPRPGFGLRVIAALVGAMILWAAQTGAVRADMFGPIAGNVYGNGNKALVLVMHGDSSPTYITDFVLDLARNNPSATVIHLARPGYSVAGGGNSKGSNTGKRDHYTNRNNALLAEGISAASQRFAHKELIAVGHSGGGAQVGVIVGRYPGLIDTAIMISTPFYINRWRAMRGGVWGRSESPADFLSDVPRNTRLIAATGSGDSNTVPSLAKDYVKKAQSMGLNATYVDIPGANHGFKQLHQPVLTLVTREIQN
jgi:pimeloyl-ACP methyl ester carboxylesterase